MKLPKDAFPVALLTIAGFLCYGAERITRLGFYHDDWTILSYLHFASPGFFSQMAALIQNSRALLYRPGELPIYAGLYSLFGLQPLFWQLTLLAINVSLAYAVYRIFLRHQAPRQAALLGALLFLAYPNKDATMFWPIILVNSFSLLFYCVAFLKRSDYVETGSRASLATALAALLVCLSTYDQCVFLFLLWLFPMKTLDTRLRARTLRSFLAGATLTGAWFSYKFLIIPRLFNVAYNKSIVLSPSHFVLVYWHGVLSTIGPTLSRYVLRSALEAFQSHAWAAFAAILLPLAVLIDKPSGGPARESRRLILLGAALFVLGYLPIALSDYDPSPINHLNRINQASALGFVMAAVGCGLRWLRPRQWTAVFCAGAAMLLAAHVQFAQVWSEAYRGEMDVKELVVRYVSQWPSDATLFVLLPQRFIADKAPVFIVGWDISGATQLWTEDPGRKADIVDGQTDFQSDGVHSRGVLIPYRSARLLDVRQKLFTLIEASNFRRIP